MPSGQLVAACASGMPVRTPQRRASRDAATTTPRPLGRPPTMTGRPPSSGWHARSTATKNESRSRWITTRGPGSRERSVNGAFALPRDARRFREHAHVFLKRGDQVRHDLERQDDLRAYRRPNDVVGFGSLDVLLRQWLHLAEGEGEIEWGMRDGAEVRVGPRGVPAIVWDDGEVDLLTLVHQESVGRSAFAMLRRAGNVNTGA